MTRSTRAVPRAFVAYTAATSLVAAAALAESVVDGSWHGLLDHPRFWLFAAFVALGELLPIDVPRRAESDRVTISTAFAFALLLSFGAGPAIAVYAAAVVLADVVYRTAPIKVVFNVAQYVISLAAAAWVLRALGPVPVNTVGDDLVAIMLSGLTWFAVNHVAVGAGAALFARSSIPAYLLEDVVFQAWTAGFLLTLAPLVVAAADSSLTLVPVSFAPMLAIYIGGRQAAMNEHRATHDLLTELPNRGLLRERLDSALHGTRPVVVMLIDLDDFKAVNDTLGHDYGDRLIAALAPRLQAVLGPDDTLARLGGDEFGVVLTGESAAGGGLGMAETLLTAIEQPFEVEALSLDVRASMGIAVHPEHGRDSDALLRHADVALYCAKEAQTRFETYAPQRDEHSINRLALAGQLRRGIDAGELIVHYQPKLALPDGTPHGVEALVRWQHPDLGIVGPDGFIGLAEQTGLIKPLTMRVLDVALRQCHDWRHHGLAVRMAVNVSTRSLMDRELVGSIEQVLSRWAVDPAWLQLEITESRIVSDFQRAEAVLDEIRALGVSIAIDDFGTGFSSLAQLQQLPVDEIKIDRSFVMDMESNPRNAAIVRATIDLGRDLGLAVTAEGIETAGAYRQLAELGCDYAQGYLISRPTTAEACAEIMRGHARGARLGVVAEGSRR